MGLRQESRREDEKTLGCVELRDKECISQVIRWLVGWVRCKRIAKQDSSGSVKIGNSRNCWRKDATDAGESETAGRQAHVP